MELLWLEPIFHGVTSIAPPSSYIPVQPVAVVLSLDSSHPSVLVETQIPLQSVECEGQQCLYCERWEGRALSSSVM